MAGMLSAGGGYRRTVLAVAVTGTVCAGVGLVVYAGLKKLKEKKSFSGRGVEATSGKASVESQVPAKSPEATKGATEIAEKPKVEATPPSSVKDEGAAQSKTQIEKPSQSQAESKPAPPSKPPAPSQPAASPPSKPPAPSQAAAAPPSKPPAPSQAAAAPPSKPPAPSQAAAAPPSKPPVPSQAAESPPKAPAQPEPPKPTATEKTPPSQPKVESPVAEKSEAVKVSTVSDPFQFAKVESVATPDVKVKEAAKVPPKEEVATVPAAIDKVVASAKATFKETLDSATSKASGDGPDSLSLSSIDSKLDSDIVVIDDVKAASVDMGRLSEGSGDVIGAPVAPVVGVPLPEMLTPPEMPSMGALSSLSDDIEIIQDSPPSTDTTDSGDFVKCDRNVDLSQSIEILKEPKSEDKSEEVQGKIEQPSTTEAAKQTGPVTTGSVGDDNANFQPPSLKAEEKDQPTIEQKPQENK